MFLLDITIHEKLNNENGDKICDDLASSIDVFTYRLLLGKNAYQRRHHISSYYD